MAACDCSFVEFSELCALEASKKVLRELVIYAFYVVYVTFCCLFLPDEI